MLSTVSQSSVLLEWRDRLDRINSKLFSSNHKIVTYHLHCTFVDKRTERLETGFFLVQIGKKPSRFNLIGMTGLSDWTVRTVIDELVLNHFLKKILAPGTIENNYQDTKLYLKPSPLWIPEKFRIEIKSNNRKRIARCPHCMTSLANGGYQYICKQCGGIFDEPYFTVSDK